MKGSQLELDLSHLSMPARGRSGEAAFLEFHEANPQVLQNLHSLALSLLGSGVKRFGMRLLWERLRWEYLLRIKRKEEDFKMNDHYVPYYARLLMATDPRLDGIFELRALRGAPERIVDEWRREGARV